MRITTTWLAFNLFRLVAVGFTVFALVAQLLGLINDVYAYAKFQAAETFAKREIRVHDLPVQQYEPGDNLFSRSYTGVSDRGRRIERRDIATNGIADEHHEQGWRAVSGSAMEELEEANHGLSSTPQTMGGVFFTVVSRFSMILGLPILTIAQIGAPEQWLFGWMPSFGPQSTPLALGLLQSAVAVENMRIYNKPPSAAAYIGLFVIGCCNILIAIFIRVQARWTHLPRSPPPPLYFSLTTRLLFWMPPSRCYFELYHQSGAETPNNAESASASNTKESRAEQGLHRIKDKGPTQVLDEPMRQYQSSNNNNSSSSSSNSNSNSSNRRRGKPKPEPLIIGSTLLDDAYRVKADPAKGTEQPRPTLRKAADLQPHHDVRNGGYPTFSAGGIADSGRQVPLGRLQEDKQGGSNVFTLQTEGQLSEVPQNNADAYSGVISLRSSVGDGIGVQVESQGRKRSESDASRRKAIPEELLLSPKQDELGLDKKTREKVKQRTNKDHESPPRGKSDGADSSQSQKYRQSNSAKNIESCGHIPVMARSPPLEHISSLRQHSQEQEQRPLKLDKPPRPPKRGQSTDYDTHIAEQALGPRKQPGRSDKAARRKTTMLDMRGTHVDRVQSLIVTSPPRSGNGKPTSERKSLVTNLRHINELQGAGDGRSSSRLSLLQASSDLGHKFPLPPARKSTVLRDLAHVKSLDENKLHRRSSSRSGNPVWKNEDKAVERSSIQSVTDARMLDPAHRHKRLSTVSLASRASSSLEQPSWPDSPPDRLKRKSSPPTLPLHSPLSPFVPAGPLTSPPDRSSSHPPIANIAKRQPAAGFPLRSSMAIKRSSSARTMRTGLGVRFDPDLESRISASTQSTRSSWKLLSNDQEFASPRQSSGFRIPGTNLTLRSPFRRRFSTTSTSVSEYSRPRPASVPFSSSDSDEERHHGEDDGSSSGLSGLSRSGSLATGSGSEMEVELDIEDDGEGECDDELMTVSQS